MGKVALPSITKLEEVLELMTSPEKYKQYLADFKAQYDQVMLVLGVLDTKEKADGYLAHAQNELTRAKQEGQAIVTQAHEKLTAVDALAVDVANQKAVLSEKIQSGFQKLKHEEKVVEAKLAALIAAEKVFAETVEAKEADIAARLGKLESERAKVAELKDRIERANQVLEGA
jgi:chromosome segregation ATPase